VCALAQKESKFQCGASATKTATATFSKSLKPKIKEQMGNSKGHRKERPLVEISIAMHSLCFSSDLIGHHLFGLYRNGARIVQLYLIIYCLDSIS